MKSPASRCGFALIAVFALACSANADCIFPKSAAAIPDGKTAAPDEMKNAMAAFKAYNDEVKAFSDCIELETKERVANMQVKAMQQRKVSAAVEELQAKAKLLNEQVRIFNARS
jgi:hypothetical protein